MIWVNGEKNKQPHSWKGKVIPFATAIGGHRDLDIIALNEDQTILVIVEVKTRTSAELNEPEEAVNRKKIRNIGNAANLYLKQFNVEYDVRFDIVSVTGTSDSNAKIEHIIDAFNPLLT